MLVTDTRSSQALLGLESWVSGCYLLFLQLFPWQQQIWADASKALLWVDWPLYTITGDSTLHSCLSKNTFHHQILREPRQCGFRMDDLRRDLGNLPHYLPLARCQQYSKQAIQTWKMSQVPCEMLWLISWFHWFFLFSLCLCSLLVSLPTTNLAYQAVRLSTGQNYLQKTGAPSTSWQPGDLSSLNI